MSHPKVDSNAYHVCVFDGLLDLDVLIAKHLYLLSMVPKTGVETVQKHGRLTPPSVFQARIVRKRTQPNINFL